MLACTICNVRKEKRFCLAIHGRICPQCCGEQREVSLDCPSECPYLQQARQHEKARDLGELNREALFPDIDVAEQFLYEHEHLIMGISFALARAARTNTHLTDRDLIAALTSLATSYKTLVNSSLIYEQPTANVTHQSIAASVQSMVQEYRDAEQKHLGYSRLHDSDVLKAIVFLLRMGLGRTTGRPKSRAYVDFLLAQFPENQGAIASPAESSRIIVL